MKDTMELITKRANYWRQAAEKVKDTDATLYANYIGRYWGLIEATWVITAVERDDEEQIAILSK